MPIMVTDVLREYGIKTLSYCDDGILFGEDGVDYRGKLQLAFDNSQSGVKVHVDKSGFVKENGE
jgi:hypothetical protein